MQEVNFEGNLRESMAKYNVTSLFDGMFAKTASSLMAKTRLGSKVRLIDGKALQDTLHRYVQVLSALHQAEGGMCTRRDQLVCSRALACAKLLAVEQESFAIAIQRSPSQPAQAAVVRLHSMP